MFDIAEVYAAGKSEEEMYIPRMSGDLNPANHFLGIESFRSLVFVEQISSSPPNFSGV